MANTQPSTTTTFGRLIFWAASIALIMSFALFILEKSQVTNLYTKPVSTVSTSPIPNVAPVNTVDYTPATDPEKDEGDQIKQDAAAQDGQNSTTNNISVSLSAASQDEKGGPIVVRAIINGGNGGQCKVTLTGNGLSKELTAAVQNVGTYNSCEGFDIPITEISSGSYTLDLTVTSGSSKGSITQTVEVSK